MSDGLPEIVPWYAQNWTHDVEPPCVMVTPGAKWIA
jgi:hypothetical protein